MTSIYNSLNPAGQGIVNAAENAAVHFNPKNTAPGSAVANGHNYRKEYVQNCYNFWGFGGGGGGSSSKNDTRVAIAIIGVAVILVSSYFLGMAMGERAEAIDENEKLKSVKKELKKLPKDVQETCSKVVKAHQNLVSGLMSKAIFKVAAIATILGGGIFAVIGAIAASELLMIGGSILVVAPGAVMLARAGYESIRNPLQKAVDRVFNAVQETRATPAAPVVVVPTAPFAPAFSASRIDRLDAKGEIAA